MNAGAARIYSFHRFAQASLGLLILLLGLGLGLGTAASAQSTFYVATDGSDASGDGSIGAPWASISHAMGQIPDESLVLVRPGLYLGQTNLHGIFAVGVTIRSEVPYQARLRAAGKVIACYGGQGITIEGFDMAQTGWDASPLLIHISDGIGDPGGEDYVSRITIRDNVLHDSYNNDILKINNGAGDILVEGNVFYNQQGRDEHIDLNSVIDIVVQDNIFLNDFSGSGRDDDGTSSFIVIKDSNGDNDGRLGSERITVRRNVFLHYEGSDAQGYVRVGEDGTANHEARHVLIENNLLLGDNTLRIRSPFIFFGVEDVTVRANTVAGDLPGREYGLRVGTYQENPTNIGVHFHNNIWSDPTGSMGDVFSRGDDTDDFSFDNNLFWNAGNIFPTSGEAIVEVTDDAHGVIGDPLLGNQAGLLWPRWLPDAGTFADGSATIREAFLRLVEHYGRPAPNSPAIDAADPAWSPTEDILGRPRPPGSPPDIGCLEVDAVDSGLEESSWSGLKARF